MSRLTRRDVLRGAAVAGAVALVDPGSALARTAAQDAVFGRDVGTIRAGESASIPAPRPFSLVGVSWSAPRTAGIELRTRLSGGGWGPWATASVLGHVPDGAAPAERSFGEPIWVGPAREVQLRSSERVAGVRLHFVASAAGGGAIASGAGNVAAPAGNGAVAGVAQGLPLAQPVLDAGPGQPPVIARGGWAHGHAPPRHSPEYGTVKLAFVHHSETPNGYGRGQVGSILFSIFAYHRYVRDYFDIAYNFAVDAFGRIWEARAGGIDLPVIGAHAGGYNAESTGVVVLGSFMSAPAPPAALTALEALLAWKLSLHGVPALGRVPVEVSPDGAAYTPFAPGAHVSLPRIAGHRDGDQTSCPGNALYAQLPGVRGRVAQQAGTPGRLRIVPPPAVPVSAGATLTLGGGLAELATGAPIAGATIELQQIGGVGGESTIATAVTDASGSWSAVLTPGQNLLLRALSRAAPAAVSNVVAVSVAPEISMTLVSTSPLTVSGTVAPAGVGPVTIDVYRVRGAGPGRRLVASKSVGVPGGAFHARVRHPGPGRYVLVARTAASARYAAGASAPLPVTL